MSQRAASINDNALPVITCHKVYYAIKNPNGTYGDPVYLENLTEIGVEKTVNSDNFYAEGVLKHTENTVSELPVTLSIGDLKEVDELALLGHKSDKNGLLVRNVNDVAPEVALMFTVKKAEGVYRAHVLYDGKFAPSGFSATTKESNTTYQPRTITGTFKPLDDGTTDASKILTTLADVEEFFKEVPTPDFTA